MFLANKGFDKERRLHLAARDGDIERISDLLESGDNVNNTNADGDTPLHLAVWKQSKPAIRLLVLSGASTIKHDARGKSPLEKAKQWGGEELGAFLNKVLEDHYVLRSDLRKYMITGDWNEFDKTLQYRGLINICLVEGRTLLQVAAQLDLSDAIRKLLDRGADMQAQDQDGQTALHIAAQSGSFNAIRQLLNSGADIQAQDQDGRTALYVAAQSGSFDAVQQLLNHGADIQAQDKDIQTALHIAAQSGSFGAIRKLLDCGVNIQSQDKDGWTALHIAAQSGSFNAIQQLLDCNTDIQAQDKDGRTALHVAAQSGSFGAIRKLLDCDANIQAQDKDSRTALHMAAQSGSSNAIQQLLNHSADIQAQDKDGWTALHIAAQSGSFNAIQELLNFGADIQAQDKDNQTALHIATQIGSVKAVQQLLDHSADIQAQNKDGWTALHIAAQLGSFDAIQQLLNYGADTQAQDKDNRTALHIATQSDSFDAIQQLLDYDADIQAQDKDGRTALHVAAQLGLLGAIQKLLDCGADIQAQDKDGSTALHIAAQLGSYNNSRRAPRVIQQLLYNGADIQAQDKDGRTALHVAAQFNSYSGDQRVSHRIAKSGLYKGVQHRAIQELLDFGADIQAQDKDSRTALHIATQSGSFKAIRQLLNHSADIQAQDKDGWTALHIAAQLGSFNAIQQLLNYGADIQAQDKDNRTALHIATQSGSFKAIRQLLNHGANIQAQTREGGTVLYKVVAGNNENGQINSVDNDGKTPLHLAAQAGHASVVRLLVSLGSVGSANLADYTGKTPLHLAAEAGHKSTIQLLLEGRAAESVSVADNDGKTPLHLATKAGHESAIELLVTQGNKLSLSLDSIVIKKPPGSSSNDRTLLTDVSVSETRSTRWDSSMMSSLRNSSADAFQSICSLFLTSELPPHTFRIRWTCHCGHRSHDDYISERRVVKSITDRINSSGIKAEIVTWRESGMSTLLLALKNMALSGHRKYAGSHRESDQSTSPNLRADMNLGINARSLNQCVQGDTQDISEMELDSTGGGPIKAVKGEVKDDVRFLHLCIHGESKLPCVGHVMIDSKSVHAKIINGDQQLFKEIKERYLKACEKRMTVFIKLKGIYFVQFRLFPRTIVGGLKENKIPTDASEYDFEEVQELKDGDSPIPPNVMLHFYNKPDHILDDGLCLNAFPKRRLEPLYWKRGQSNVGYGIYLKEELDEMLFALIRGSIALSVGVIGWIVFLVRRDLEKSYPWPAVLWISGIGVCALEVLKEWLKARFESGATKEAKIE